MSYDLMVFEPGAAPLDHRRFLDWYRVQSKWSEHHSYADPAMTSTQLHAWYYDIVQRFPSLNGVSSEEELPDDEATATEYSIGKQIIYACFAWSKVDDAYGIAFKLAAKHRLGFFNVSSEDEEVWLPNGQQLVLAHARTPPSIMKRLERLFRRD